MAGPYLSWSCSTADCQLRLSVLYGTMQVHYVRDDPTVQALEHAATDVNLLGNIMGLFVVVSCLILVHTGHPLIQKRAHCR